MKIGELMWILQKLKTKKYNSHWISQNFTLVELLIVLAILAGLLTVATVSMDSLQAKHYADKTQSRGNQIKEVLEKNNGLSFVSDMGRLPGRDISGLTKIICNNELEYIFTYIDPATNGHDADYKERNFSIPTEPTSGIGVPLPSHIQFDVSRNSYDKFSAGWRGPYNDSQGREIKDGWDNDFDIIFEKDDPSDPAGSEKLQGVKSLGRKHDDDSVITPEGWQEEDISFKVQNNLLKAELNITVYYRDSNGDKAGNFDELRVLFYSPDATQNFSSVSIRNALFHYKGGTNRPSIPVSSTLPITWTDTNGASVLEDIVGTTQDHFLLTNLTIGKHKLYIYGYGTPDDGTTWHWYASTIITLNLKPGTNNINIILQKL